MGDRVGVGLPGVDDECATSERRVERGVDQRRDLRHDPAQQARTGLVERPHPREIARERRLPGEQRPGEQLDLHRRQQRVVATFEPDGRPRRRRRAGRAQRPRPVGRIDHHRILVRQQHVVEGAVHRRGERLGVFGAEKVRPPDRAHEHRAAREQQERLVGARRVGDGVADVLGCVAGRGQGAEADRPDVERLRVGQRAVHVRQLGAGPDDVRRACQRGELTAARHVVVVEVRLDDMRDAQVVRPHG